MVAIYTKAEEPAPHPRLLDHPFMQTRHGLKKCPAPEKGAAGQSLTIRSVQGAGVPTPLRKESADKISYTLYRRNMVDSRFPQN